MTKSRDKQYILAIDAGGTMTDAFLADEMGRFVIGKALTNRESEPESYLSSVEDAASYWELTAPDVHRDADFILYAGTTLLNILLTGTGEKVGLLLTRGLEHIVYQERGLLWMSMSYQDRLHAQLRTHNPELVDHKLIRGITERIGGGSYYGPAHYEPGKVIFPLSEREVRDATNYLLDQGVRAIAILFLYSYLNPAHERRAAEIVEEIIAARGADAWVVPSHIVSPVGRETSRLNSTIVEASAAQPLKEQLEAIESLARDQGYKADLLTMLGYGGSAKISYPRLHESMISGPVGGILGAKVVGELLDKQNIVCADMGGTSFDVGLIVKGIVGVNREPDFANRRFAMPMLIIDSIDAGAGGVVRVEPTTKRILLGPESAGSDVGYCFRYPTCTVSDIDVALGYLDPDNFLGGKYQLDHERAIEALTKQVAEPLGADPYRVGESVLGLLNGRARDHMSAMLLARGYDASEFTLFCYGGAGPLHLWGFAEGFNLEEIVTFPWAGAFSAFGGACVDHVHRLHRGLTAFVTPGMPDEGVLAAGEVLTSAWRELEETLFENFAAEGHPRSAVKFRAGVQARYIGQIEGITADVPTLRIENVQDMSSVIDAFERAYLTMYPEGARFPEAGVFISEVYIEGVVKKAKPIIPEYSLESSEPVQSALKGQRQVFHQSQWQPFAIWDMDGLLAGNHVDGPAIIEHPMTTLVVPPGKRVEFDKYRIIHYRDR